MRKLTCTKVDLEDPDKPGNCRYVFELESGPDHGMRGVDVLNLYDEEAEQLALWLADNLGIDAVAVLDEKTYKEKLTDAT